MCKFGVSCKYHHPRQGGEFVSPMSLNISGYPLRPGEKECSYYVKTGQCKFGVTCKFHHPQPSGIQISGPSIYPTAQSPSSQQYGVVAGNWPVARPALLPGSYIPGTYGPVLLSPGMVPFSGWNPYQAPLSPIASPNTQPTVGENPVYGATQLSSSAPAYTGPYLSIPSFDGPSRSNHREQSFPERPGQPECQYYIRTGSCKFGSSCRYHHPVEWSAEKAIFSLSHMGLPLRPGAPLCTHYAQNGVCRFGPSCKFDHPMGGTVSYGPSAFSLTDLHVGPYSVGSSIVALASSSSSVELRPELISESNVDPISMRMSSSVNMSSGSVGSNIQPPPHSSTHSSGSSITGHGGEVASN